MRPPNYRNLMQQARALKAEVLQAQEPESYGEMYARVSRAYCSPEDNAMIDAITEAVRKDMQAQEPVGSIERCEGGYYRDSVVPCAPFDRPVWTDGKMPPSGTKLYTTPHPPAPCPETEQILKALDLDIQVNTLQAKVESLEAEQVRLDNLVAEQETEIIKKDAMIEMCHSSFDFIRRMPKSYEATRRAAQALADIEAHRSQHSELAAQCSESLPQCSELERDAARYRLVRRGQHWSVIDGIGDTLRAEGLDEAVDDVIAEAKP